MRTIGLIRVELGLQPLHNIWVGCGYVRPLALAIRSRQIEEARERLVADDAATDGVVFASPVVLGAVEARKRPRFWHVVSRILGVCRQT